ncbi:hypothetical protein ETU09_02740 [Apibacter muscae]|uniref:Uncharacterized protein n=1 Tax=Apibacter muscae TaxID=2509004 RepID=A0A563DIF2_9FLAO|nr:hypothetical protein [Apibacter muscae]TWP29917.1 hypothetical protein ETU09_02740 [Apibacter muscae]
MNARESFQKEILEEIKLIAKELSNIQNLYGLLTYQQKIQNLYEKFIFLKQLNTSKYQQILENHSEVAPKTEEPRDFYSNVVNEPPIEPVISTTETPKDSVVVEETEPNLTPTTEELVSSSDESVFKTNKLKPLDIEIADIAPLINKDEKTYSENLSASKINLPPVSPSFGDSITFISQLFKGSKAAMDNEFKLLNQTQSLEEAKKWIEQMFVKYDWKNKGLHVERLSQLIVERFNSLKN